MPREKDAAGHYGVTVPMLKRPALYWLRSHQGARQEEGSLSSVGYHFVNGLALEKQYFKLLFREL